MKAIKSIKVDAEIHKATKAQAESRGMTLRGYIKMLVANDREAIEHEELGAKLLKIVEDNYDKPENLEAILRVVESALDEKVDQDVW